LFEHDQEDGEDLINGRYGMILKIDILMRVHESDFPNPGFYTTSLADRG